MAKVLGYNIGLSLQGMKILGRTQDDFNMSAVTKESITKDDKGVKNVVVTGHDYTFSVSGLITVDDKTTGALSRDQIIAMANRKGSEAVYPFTYDCGSSKSITGNCIITGYSESSNSEDEATYSINCQVTGDITIS